MTESMYSIDDFIPHRDRMKLINDIIEVDDGHCVTQSMVTSLWPLYEGGHVNSIVIVELVAQTASAFAGWQKRNKTKTGGEGVIVGIKKAVLNMPSIPVGTILRTSCRMLVNLNEQYAEFEGEVRNDHTSYGRVQLQTFSAQDMMRDRNVPVP